MARKYASDPALIEACLRGDEAAWHTLVEQYGRLVNSIPRRYGFSEADADDVFQTVFATLVRRLESLKDRTKLSAWLITTAHRECWRRGKRSPAGLELDERDIAADAPPGDLMELWERQDLVHRGLKRLGGICRDLLEALFMRTTDQGYEAIAEELGMKVGSIGPTRARCFQKLEKILRSLGFSSD